MTGFIKKNIFRNRLLGDATFQKEREKRIEEFSQQIGYIKKSNCYYCEKEFDFRLGSSIGMFCSRECYNQSISIPQKECVVCNKLYTPDRSTKDRWEKSRFCSVDCQTKSKIKGKYSPCGYCKSPVWTRPSEMNNNRFCSKRCHALSKKGRHPKATRKGYRAEREARKELEAQGYLTMRNFLSWGASDVLAIGDAHMRFIQSKSSKYWYKPSAYSKDVKRLLSYNVPSYATKELWMRTDYKGWRKYLVTENSIKPLEQSDLDNVSKRKLGEIKIYERGLIPFQHPKKIADCIVEIDRDKKKVNIFQCHNSKDKTRIENELSWLNDEFMCTFAVVNNEQELKILLENLEKAN